MRTQRIITILLALACCTGFARAQHESAWSKYKGLLWSALHGLDYEFRAGVNGYCGVGANYYPKLFQLLWHHCESSGAEELGHFIAANDHLADLGNAYPVSAKFMAQLHGLPVSLCCRITDRTIDDADRLSLRKLDSDAGLLIRNFSAVPSMETA